MAPSTTETVQHVVEQIPQKLALKPEPSNGHAIPADGRDDGLPKVETNHREPLKLRGALDHFNSFDVTPVIGREFPDANLAKWLRSPNSDDLLRDLAITSTFQWQMLDAPITNTMPHSLSTWCCLLQKAR